MVAILSPQRCGNCYGTGDLPEPRSRWIGGGQYGQRLEWVTSVLCEECNGTGRTLAIAVPEYAVPVDDDDAAGPFGFGCAANWDE